MNFFKIFIPLFLLSACATDMEHKLDSVRNGYASGTSPVLSANKFNGNESDFADMDNLEILITADAMFRDNQFKNSDTAFEDFNKRGIDYTGFDLSRELGTLLGGNMANEYRPYMMDSLFVSYYQIWDNLALNDFNTARVVINQSYEKQKNMSIAYDELINATNESLADSDTDTADEILRETQIWRGYNAIMNPALTYLSGLYFLNMGDFADAKTYLERTTGMVPDNEYVRRDLISAKNKIIPDNTVWFFIETGFAPKLYEKRTNIPMIIDYNVTFVPIAMSYPAFYDNDTHIKGSQILADVDAMFITEYSQYRINESLRSAASAASRAALQAASYGSNSNAAPLMGLAAQIYSQLSTSAEIRTWATLPQYIWLYRVSKPADGQIVLKSTNGAEITISVPTNGNHLIYVRENELEFDIKTIKIK